MNAPHHDPQQRLAELGAQLAARRSLPAAARAAVRRRVPAYEPFLTRQGDRLDATVSALISVLCDACRGEEFPPDLPPLLQDLGRRRCDEGLPLDLSLEVIWVLGEVVESALARQVGRHPEGDRITALARARLGETERRLVREISRGYFRQFREQRAELQALLGIGRAANTSLETGEVAEASLRETARAMGLDAGALWMTAGGRSRPELIASHGLSPDQLADLGREDVRRDPLVSAALEAADPVQSTRRARFGSANPAYSAIAVPLRLGDELLGVMALGTHGLRRFTEAESGFVALVAEQVAIALQHARQHRLEARTDYLTGLANRPEFDRSLAREVSTAGRHGRRLSVLLFDLDRLKSINDEHGHHCGDQAIRAASEAIRGVVRSTDTCARIGGDEFALAVPEADLGQAREVAVRIRRALDQINRSGVVPARISLSCGLATWKAGLDAPGLMELADQSLYRDKRGRRVRRYDPEGEPELVGGVRTD